MRKMFFPAILLAAALFYLLRAGSNLYTHQDSFSIKRNVLNWMPVGGSAVAVLKDEILLENMHLTLESSTAFRQLGSDHFGLMTHRGENIEFRWFDSDGNEVGRIQQEWPADISLPRFMLDRADNRLISVDMLNRLRIFSTDGRLISENQIFDGYRYHTENSIYATYVESGRYLFCGLTQVFPSLQEFPAYKTTLKYIDLGGNSRLAAELEGWQINALYSRDDGQLHVISLYRYDPEQEKIDFKVHMYDGEGEMIYDIDQSFRRIVFGGQESVLLFDRDSVVVFDLSRGKITGTYRLTNAEQILMAAEYIPAKDTYILEAGNLSQSENHWIYTDIALISINREADILDTMILDTLSVYQPVLKYDLQLNHIFIGHSSGWIRLQVN